MRQGIPKEAIDFIFCWPGAGQHLKRSLLPRENPLETTKFSFAGIYPSEIAPALGIGACVHVSSLL